MLNQKKKGRAKSSRRGVALVATLFTVLLILILGLTFLTSVMKENVMTQTGKLSIMAEGIAKGGGELLIRYMMDPYVWVTTSDSYDGLSGDKLILDSNPPLTLRNVPDEYNIGFLVKKDPLVTPEGNNANYDIAFDRSIPIDGNYEGRVKIKMEQIVSYVSPNLFKAKITGTIHRPNNPVPMAARQIEIVFRQRQPYDYAYFVQNARSWDQVGNSLAPPSATQYPAGSSLTAPLGNALSMTSYTIVDGDSYFTGGGTFSKTTGGNINLRDDYATNLNTLKFLGHTTMAADTPVANQTLSEDNTNAIFKGGLTLNAPNMAPLRFDSYFDQVDADGNLVEGKAKTMAKALETQDPPMGKYFEVVTPAIIGHKSASQVEVTEDIKFTTADGLYLLPHTPVVSIESVTTTDGLTTFTEGNDYQLTPDKTKISWAGTGEEPAIDEYFRVTYTYTISNDTQIREMVDKHTDLDREFQETLVAIQEAYMRSNIKPGPTPEPAIPPIVPPNKASLEATAKSASLVYRGVETGPMSTSGTGGTRELMVTELKQSRPADVEFDSSFKKQNPRFANYNVVFSYDDSTGKCKVNIDKYGGYTGKIGSNGVFSGTKLSSFSDEVRGQIFYFDGGNVFVSGKLKGKCTIVCGEHASRKAKEYWVYKDNADYKLSREIPPPVPAPTFKQYASYYANKTKYPERPGTWVPGKLDTKVGTDLTEGSGIMQIYPGNSIYIPYNHDMLKAPKNAQLSNVLQADQILNVYDYNVNSVYDNQKFPTLDPWIKRTLTYADEHPDEYENDGSLKLKEEYDGIRRLKGNWNMTPPYYLSDIHGVGAGGWVWPGNTNINHTIIDEADGAIFGLDKSEGNIIINGHVVYADQSPGNSLGLVAQNYILTAPTYFSSGAQEFDPTGSEIPTSKSISSKGEVTGATSKGDETVPDFSVRALVVINGALVSLNHSLQYDPADALGIGIPQITPLTTAEKAAVCVKGCIIGPYIDCTNINQVNDAGNNLYYKQDRNYRYNPPPYFPKITADTLGANAGFEFVIMGYRSKGAMKTD